MVAGDDHAAHQRIRPLHTSDIHRLRMPPPPPDTSVEDAARAEQTELRRLSARSCAAPPLWLRPLSHLPLFRTPVALHSTAQRFVSPEFRALTQQPPPAPFVLRYRLKTRANDFKQVHQILIDQATQGLADFALSLDPYVDADPERYIDVFHTRPKHPVGPSVNPLRQLNVVRPEMNRRQAETRRTSAHWIGVVRPSGAQTSSIAHRETHYAANALRTYLSRNGLPPSCFIG